jgi:UDP-N-acetylmuramoyl-L-alanyl-D-glutamate--2,6-diaminopimelate ligase
MAPKLADIVEDLPAAKVIGPADIGISGITSDSRRVEEGALFACIRGAHQDGHTFAESAIRAGAVAALTQERLSVPLHFTQVIVPDTRAALAHVAARFYGRPSEELRVVGITGTNGKTTTVHYLRSILEAAGEPAGTMGTLGHWLGNGLTRDSFTTPEAPDLHRYMRDMVDRGLRYCVMEVSSHAIALGRVDQVSFDVVAFTNLTRDHLDFHGDLEEYRDTKMRLFGIDDEGRAFGSGRKAVVNIGDETGRRIRDLTPLPTLTYCLCEEADVAGEIVEMDSTGSLLAVGHDLTGVEIRLALKGRMNAENALAAYAVAILLGIEPKAIAAGIAGLKEVPGRMEFIPGPGRDAIVDYAHTPDALRRLLEDVRQITSGRIICVFGCGGDRDRGKRPEMGRIAGQLADVVIVTSDNPRSEDPVKIIGDVLQGIPKKTDYEVISDRARAIQRAVAMSADGDVLVIAGKGHEDYQIVGDQRIHFDDREAVRKAFGVISGATT